jgi:hypothetical protein
MRAHVGELVDTNAEPLRHVAKCFAYRASVFAEVPRAASATAAEDDMHRSARAHWALELATVRPDGPSVLCPSQLPSQLVRKK